MIVKFTPLIDVALLPRKAKVEEPEFTDDSSRWIANRRVKGACWPYRMAKEIGWTIRSPVDVEIHPVREIQVRADRPEEFARLKQYMPMEDWTQKREILIGISPASWYKVHEYRYRGLYYPMFLPNGEGTFEWRQGWRVEVPSDHVALIYPAEEQDGRFVAHPGLLYGATLSRVQERLGLPIAFEPLRISKIRRGEPIAKLLVLPKSVLSLKSMTVDEDSGNGLTLSDRDDRESDAQPQDREG